MLISLIAFVIIIILATYFASTNLTGVDINLVGYPLHGTSGMLIVSALGIGVFLGILFMLPIVISRSWSAIRQRRKLQDVLDAVQRKNYSGKNADKE